MPALFDEILLDPDIFASREGGSPVQGSPTFANTKHSNPATGISKINVNRFDAIEILNVDMALMTPADLLYLLRIWRGGYGNAVGFRVRIPHDYYVTLESFATGNGVLTTFNLYVTYTRPGVTARQDVRRIIKPVNDTPARLTNLGGAGGSVRLYEPDGTTARVITYPFKIYFGAVEQTTGWTVNNTTGVVTFSVAPPNGTIIKWSGEFDVPMRFVDNSLPLRPDPPSSSEATGVRLEEILYTELL